MRISVFSVFFDRDEKGTYLSVNSDFWGTVISYLGYALLTLGMIWTFFSKKHVFMSSARKSKNCEPKVALLSSFCFYCSLPRFWSQTQQHSIKMRYRKNMRIDLASCSAGF